MLGEAGGEIDVMTETVQVAGAQGAGASRIDGDDDIEMLVLGVIATDQSAASRRRLPIDGVLRIAGTILAKLQNLRARALVAMRSHAAAGGADSSR